ncbi:MAG TPA: hypothetical protein VGR28_00255 [Candidatus Thermoplasmatota archaeon]|jgi:hypothetical protein|nr:hypothetical protein [Candidatus Thermoplasmatota archaeon]
MALTVVSLRRSKVGLALMAGGLALFALGSVVPLCGVLRYTSLPYNVSCEPNLLLMVPGMALMASGLVWAMARQDAV